MQVNFLKSCTLKAVFSNLFIWQVDFHWAETSHMWNMKLQVVFYQNQVKTQNLNIFGPNLHFCVFLKILFYLLLLFLFYVPCSAKGQRYVIRRIILQFVHQICFWKKCDQFRNVVCKSEGGRFGQMVLAAVVLQMRTLEQGMCDSKWYLAGEAELWSRLWEKVFMCETSVPYTQLVQDGFGTTRYSWWQYIRIRGFGEYS